MCLLPKLWVPLPFTILLYNSGLDLKRITSFNKGIGDIGLGLVWLVIRFGR